MMARELEYIERTLVGEIICSRCKATLETYASACTADLDDPCPGFMTIEKVKQDFRRRSMGKNEETE